MNNLAIGLINLGHEVAIGAYYFENLPPSPIPSVNLSKFRNLPKFLNSTKYVDIIHSHHGKMNYYSIFSSKPFIFHYHGASNKLQETNLRISLLLCRKRISKIIHVSHFAMNHMRKVTGSLSSGIPAEVVRNGVDSNFYRTGLPRKYKVGYPQLLFVGNLYRYKNVTKIIEEIPHIRRTFPDVCFQIVGDGAEFKYILRLVRDKHLENSVQLFNTVSDEELRLIYSSSDIYVSASGFETVGMPLMEAMSCGKPILVSDIPAHKELLEASNGGVIFSAADKNGVEKGIRNILDNENMMVSNARKFAQDNDWSKVCIRLSRTYNDIMRLK
jgi:glycosyltransferase involved in cell wall biosynthesis